MIIDFHTHYFPERVAQIALPRLAKAIESEGVFPVTDATIKDNLLHADKSNVDYQVALNIAVTPHQEESILHSVLSNEEKRIIPFGSVHPHSEKAVENLKIYHDNGIKGIKIHPEYQSVDVDDKSYFKIYELCGEYGMIVSVHAGWDVAYPDSRRATPEALKRVVEKFPKTTFVMAHMGGMKMWNDVEECLVGCNCYLDTSMVATLMTKGQFVRICDNHGAERILFGSDLPWQDERINLDYIISSGLKTDDIEKIIGKNAKNLLNL